MTRRTDHNPGCVRGHEPLPRFPIVCPTCSARADELDCALLRVESARRALRLRVLVGGRQA